MPSYDVAYNIGSWAASTTPAPTVVIVTPAPAAPGGCNPSISSSNGPKDPLVTNGPEAGQITVTGKVQLDISIVDASDGANTFTPIGLAVHPDGKVGTGGSVFPPATQGRSNGQPTIVVSDEPPAGGGTASWDFVVLFQDQNGNFGLLDPMIRNIS